MSPCLRGSRWPPAWLPAPRCAPARAARCTTCVRDERARRRACAERIAQLQAAVEPGPLPNEHMYDRQYTQHWRHQRTGANKHSAHRRLCSASAVRTKDMARKSTPIVSAQSRGGCVRMCARVCGGVGWGAVVCAHRRRPGSRHPSSAPSLCVGVGVGWRPVGKGCAQWRASGGESQTEGPPPTYVAPVFASDDAQHRRAPADELALAPGGRAGVECQGQAGGRA